MKYIVRLFLVLLPFQLQAQQDFKLGLTLSGGGAKGLAHIGILQAIDSAGLKVDYVTGTSMGSIMGALYAVGYSGNRIEELALQMDWGKLFSGTPDMSTVNITEKDEFENYALEIPFEKGKVKIGTGLIEAQEIWVKFQELFLAVYDVKDFDDFSIPFRCIATDVATGNRWCWIRVKLLPPFAQAWQFPQFSPRSITRIPSLLMGVWCVISRCAMP